MLIVDDSQFFRKRLAGLINEHPDLDVIGVAENGLQAVEKAKSLKPDIMTMDYEMPFLDGISAVKEILKDNAIPIIMFSSLTYEGASVTLDALDAGAVDFVLKNFTDVSSGSVGLKSILHNKLITFAKKANPRAASAHVPTSTTSPTNHRIPIRSTLHSNKDLTDSGSNNRVMDSNMSCDSIVSKPDAHKNNSTHKNKEGQFKGRLQLLLIGASTGGPVAVSDVICGLPKNFPVPVVVIQHMPEKFTQAFSERLNSRSHLNVKQAETGDSVRPGHVFIAPGGKQLLFDCGGSKLKIIDGDERMNYKPSVDITFASAANHFSNKVLAVVLTGMGADGCEGARLLKQRSSYVWSQDKASCVVYGMPAAVTKAGLSDAVYNIKDIAAQLIHQV